MIAILCTDGVSSLSKIYSECETQHWVSILVYRNMGDETPVIIGFKSEAVTQQFAKHNMPRSWLRGAIYLTEKHIETIKSKGWKFEIFCWPRCLNINSVDFGFEVIDFKDNPEISASSGGVNFRNDLYKKNRKSIIGYIT